MFWTGCEVADLNQRQKTIKMNHTNKIQFLVSPTDYHDGILMKAWEPSEAHAGDCNGSHTHSVCHVHILSTLPNWENHPLK